MIGAALATNAGLARPRGTPVLLEQVCERRVDALVGGELERSCDDARPLRMRDEQAVVVARVAERRWSHPSAAIERPSLGVLPRLAHASPFHARQRKHDRHAELAERRRRIEAEVERRDRAAGLRDLFDQAQRVGHAKTAQAIEFRRRSRRPSRLL